MSNKLFKLFSTRYHTLRHLHTSLPTLSSVPLLSEALTNRRLIRVAGPDTLSFLQGLVTADVNQLHNGEKGVSDKSVYAMMLNSQGRVLYDVFLYRVDKLYKQDSSILIECEGNLAADIASYLKKYKLRRKLQFSVLDDTSVWVIMKAEPETLQKDLNPAFPDNDQALYSQPDPRLPWLAHRMLLPNHLKVSDILERVVETTGAYRQLRYEHGVAEGPSELPPSSSIPLETNLHFLNGVSFSKGCYIGQELTARTHHTGVIRKRIMPLSSKQDLKIDTTTGDYRVLSSSTNKECGRVRGWQGVRGLGLLRLQECLLNPGPLLLVRKAAAEGEGDVGDGKAGLEDVVAEVTTHIPGWWPVQQDQIIRGIVAKINHT